MKREPVDYSNPLGISKKEWVKVLGVNLAILLITYAVALVCTLCRNDAFVLGFKSESLDNIERVLRSGWNAYPLIQAAFATVEETIILTFVIGRKPRLFAPFIYFALLCSTSIILSFFINALPSWITLVYGVLFIISYVIIQSVASKEPKKIVPMLVRLLVAGAISLALNACISYFRKSALGLGTIFENSAFFALSIEYDIALALSLGTIALAYDIRKGGKGQCLTSQDAGGYSPSTTSSSPKNSKTAKTNLPPKYRRKIALLKAKVITIQTLALIVIAFVPWISGRGIEFTLVYISFCATRFCLGFGRSLHFKSELSCITIGALFFWLLTYLSPSAEASIIISLCYGALTALGFRLYWELHDLMMYRRASKTDRYAMLYVVFKGNVDPKHINGVMRAKGISDKQTIQMVQMYMAKDKVEYIAEIMGFAKITIEKKLTDLANELYLSR